MDSNVSRYRYAQGLALGAALLVAGAAIGWDPYLQFALLAALALAANVGFHFQEQQQLARDALLAEREQAKRALRKSQEDFRALAAEQDAILNSRLFGIMKARNRIIVWTNVGFEKMFGYAPGGAIGVPARQHHLSEESYLAFGARAYAAIASGATFRTEAEHVRQDGTHVWVEVSGQILDRQTGESLWAFVDITERQQAAAELRAANERLRNVAADQAADLRDLAGTLQRATLSERERLYGLLHDQMQPLLVAARLSLSGLSSATPKADCLQAAAEACEHIGTVIHAARNLGLELNPPLVREQGLNPALEFLCRWVKENHDLTASLVGASGSEPEDLELRMFCFQAVRELLLNVVKHAGTGRATVTTEASDSEVLRITVADQGRGFDPLAASGGTGLLGIGRRLDMFGGTLKIDSKPGRGTLVTLSAPQRPAGRDGRAGGRLEGDGKHHVQDPDRR